VALGVWQLFEVVDLLADTVYRRNIPVT